ncbi:MAG TPA: response regulator transcription factor [Verrucomicrobiae bacterium]|nr:response regulator transcription factor [Verrucomicrobiae bacterium]
MTTKILFIEDDADLAHGISVFLDADFDLSITSNGTKGLKQFKRQAYDLVMLDLSLPDMPGLKVCQKIRQLDKEVPIFVLTGTTDTEVQIELLNAGADDYLVKPFDGRQLKARISALLRRSGLASPAVLRTHDLIMDTQKRKVRRGTETLSLRRKEYDILEYLMRNKGQIVTKATLFDHVWGKGVRPSSIDVHIKHLRDKVDRPFEVPLIETAHGVGYSVKDIPPQ